MHQATHIYYGDGKVNIVLDSASLNEVAAPSFRFADYSKAVNSCFSQKELERIDKGEIAELTFSFVVSDQIEDEDFSKQYEQSLEEFEKKYGKLQEGIYVEVEATKNVGDENDTDVKYIKDEVDIQMDIPLYLVKENRVYYYLANNMGENVIFEDASPDADVLTVKTNIISDGVILYQDIEDRSNSLTDNKFTIKKQYIFGSGIVVLLLFWFLLERIYKKSK